MASFYEAIREFSTLTRRRTAGVLAPHDERRFQSLLAFFETSTGDELPPAREADGPSPAPTSAAMATVESVGDTAGETALDDRLEFVAGSAAAPEVAAIDRTHDEPAVEAASLLEEGPDVDIALDDEAPAEPAPAESLELPAADLLTPEPAAVVESAPATAPEAMLEPAAVEPAPALDAPIAATPIALVAEPVEPEPLPLVAERLEAADASPGASFDVDVDTLEPIDAAPSPVPAPIDAALAATEPAIPRLVLPSASAPVAPEELERTPPVSREAAAAAHAALHAADVLAEAVPEAIEVADDAARDAAAIDIDVDEPAPEELAPAALAPAGLEAPALDAPPADDAADSSPSWLEAPLDTPAPAAESIEISTDAEVDGASLLLTPIADEDGAALPESAAVEPALAVDPAPAGPVALEAASEPANEVGAPIDAPVPAPAVEEPHAGEGATVRLQAADIAQLIARAGGAAALRISPAPEAAPIAEPESVDAMQAIGDAPEPIEAPSASSELAIPAALTALPSAPEFADEQQTFIRPALSLTPGPRASAPSAPQPVVPDVDDAEVLAFATGLTAEPGLDEQIAAQLPSIGAASEWAAGWQEPAADANAEPSWEAPAAPVPDAQWAQPAAAPEWNEPAPSEWASAAAEAWSEPAVSPEWPAVAQAPAWNEPAAAAPAWNEPAPTAPSWNEPAAAAPSWNEPAAAAPSWNEPAAAAPAWNEPPPAWNEPAPAAAPAWNAPAPTSPWVAPVAAAPAEPAWAEAPAQAWTEPVAPAPAEWQQPEQAWAEPEAPSAEWQEQASNWMEPVAPTAGEWSSPEAGWNAPAAANAEWDANRESVDLPDGDADMQVVASPSELLEDAAAAHQWQPAAVEEPEWAAVKTEPAMPRVTMPKPEAWGAPAAWTQPVTPGPVIAPPARTPAALPMNTPLVITGDHRIVLHTLEGGVKRGLVTDIDLAGDSVALLNNPGGPAAEVVPFTRAKALFFMLAPGEKPPAGGGRRVKVTFVDGRQVEGFLGEEFEQGFFLLPLDARTNTARVFVLNHAVRSVN